MKPFLDFYDFQNLYSSKIHGKILVYIVVKHTIKQLKCNISKSSGTKKYTSYSMFCLKYSDFS